MAWTLVALPKYQMPCTLTQTAPNVEVQVDESLVDEASKEEANLIDQLGACEE